MQTVNPVYSLYVNCREGQHDEYMQVKREFEDFFRRMEAHIKLSDQKGVAPHLIDISSAKALSFCIVNKQLYLGIYDKGTKEISRKCELDDIKSLDAREYYAIETRINNILRLKDRDILQDAKLNAAWGREIPRIIREQQEKNRSSLARTVQPETFRSTQGMPQGAAQSQPAKQPLVFNKSFEGNCQLAKEIAQQMRERKDSNSVGLDNKGNER